MNSVPSESRPFPPIPHRSAEDESELPVPRRAPDVLLLALVVGALGAASGVDRARGLNLTFLLLALTALGAWVWSRVRPEEDRECAIGFLGAGIFSLGFVVTENPGLRGFDAVAIAVLLSFPILRATHEGLRTLRPVILGHAVLELLVHLAVGGLLALIIRMAPPTRLRTDPERGSAPGPVLAGLGLSGICLLVFGSLLRSADAGFDAWVGRTVEPTWLFERAVVTLAVAGLAAGLLEGWHERPFGRETPFPARDPVQLAGPTVLIPIATLVVLFACFVSSQIGTLLAGSSTPAELATLARRGFFELVTVGGLSLVALLIGDSCLRWSSARVRKAFVFLALGLLVLVGAILASAAWRMARYVEWYGWTELRLYASAFLLWTAIALPWFGGTALRGDPRRFTSGALLAALAIGAALHCINPEAVIVRSHLGTARTQSETERPVDLAYLQTLGVDAIPAIRARIDSVPVEEREALMASWEEMLTEDRGHGAWTLARARARWVLREHLPSR